MKSFTAVSALAAALAALAPTASAANCYGSAQQGSVQQYQTTASVVCQGSDYYSWYSDCQSGPVGGQCCVFHEAWFKGTRGRRDKCWDAFNNIIAQCVEGSHRNGGDWTWSSGGLDQNYYLQANWACRSKREIRAAAAKGLVVDGSFNATADAVDGETEAAN